MPFALVIIGLLLIVTGANDNYKKFGALLAGDFTGPGNFSYWLLTFGTLGAIGYNQTMRPFARAFMLLIFLALIVRNGGFFDKFGAAIKAGPETVPAGTSAPGASSAGTGVKPLDPVSSLKAAS